MNDLIANLRNVKAFSQLSMQQLKKISGLFSTRSYQTSQLVISYGAPSQGVYFLSEGSVRTTLYSPQGREINYQDLQPGDMFGELGVIDNMPRTTHVIALENISVLWIAANDFINLLKVYPQVSQATMHKMADLIRFLCDRIYEFSALDVNQRICAELLRLAVPDEVVNNAATIQKLPKHQEFANRLTTHREAVTRELARLEKIGLTTKTNRTLIINDLEALRRETVKGTSD
ncbi:MAG: Crp/Fnr family transcriptional regulator [Pseudomonadales bacterium]|nr:Crp/Fnr family transcriptional regulator [Pseudomonadales bacterium]